MSMTAAGDGNRVSQQNLHTFNMMAQEESKKNESHLIKDTIYEQNIINNNDDEDDLDNSR